MDRSDISDERTRHRQFVSCSRDSPDVGVLSGSGSLLLRGSLPFLNNIAPTQHEDVLATSSVKYVCVSPIFGLIHGNLSMAKKHLDTNALDHLTCPLIEN
jgi:hypothetical protein